MDTSGTTPISLTGDSCLSNENRCHIATPAPSTPFPYSPLSPYGAINPYSLMSRYSSVGAHMQSPFSSSLANSMAAGLAYPPDMYHYNPYSALTPTSPLTPSSFWSLTAQQSYHQLNGITFGPTGPAVAYNTNAHLFNLFSPNSLSPMSPSPDLHSPSLYSRLSSMPSPYASSPGLSSAFMSPSSMPLLLSPSLSSSVDRPPTYLSDNTSTPSSTPSMTSSIKCEPTDGNFTSQPTRQTVSSHFHNIIDKNNSNERITEKVDSINDKHFERHSKTSKHNENNNNIKHSSKAQSIQKRITTTIRASTPTKEKHSARVEPLIRLEEIIDNVVHNDSQNSDIIIDINDNNRKTCETSTTTLKTTTNGNESPDKEVVNKDNTDLRLIAAKVKRELVECDISLPLISVNSVPNCDDITSDSNTTDVIANNTNSELSPQINTNSIDVKSDDNLETDHKNLIIDCNSSDGKEELNNRPKDAKRESQLKQLQSYRKESHRVNGNKLAVSAIDTNTTAVSIVKPKPKDQIKSSNDTEVNQSSHSANQLNTVVNHTSPTVKPLTAIPVQREAHPRTQSVIPCRTKPVHKITDNANNSSANQMQAKHNSINGKKSDNNCANDSSNQFAVNTNKTAPNSANSATKPLPKKPRMSRKPTSATIPVGIAIAQQRTSPKTKSPTDSSTNGSQPLKPILPTLSLPVMANSPILITDSPPTGTSLWIKPTPNSTLNNSNSMQTNSQFSLSGDYQLARDSLTGHLYLIRNSSSLPTTPTPKTPTIIPPLTIKSSEHQSKSSPSAIITLPVGATQPQQFFASIGQTQASTLILDTTNSSPLVQISTTAPGSTTHTHTNGIHTSLAHNNIKSGRHLESKDKSLNNVNINNNYSNNWSNVERGCQASISDDELSCDNMKTTATQVDMDVIHSSEEDEDNDGKRHKIRLFLERKQKTVEKSCSVDEGEDDESSRDSIQLQIVDEMVSDEPPQLPVKSAPVMQFIDHHGLDLLVDSIEEFAAREESNTSTTEPELPVNGLQLLSTLAEQRSREERDASALRRHSADSSITTNGFNNNQTNIEFNRLKRKQRSESCFTTNPNKFDENEELITDFKKSFKTSSCQTELMDRRVKDINNRLDNNLINLRRSERIFINDSVVSSNTVPNTKEVNALEVNNRDKDLLISKEFKRKDIFDNKFFKSNNKSINNTKAFNEKIVLPNEESIKSSVKTKDHYVFSGTKSDDLVPNLNPIKISVNINNNIKTKTDEKLNFCDINGNNNQKIIFDSTKDKTISEQKDKQKKKKLSSLSGSFSSSISSSISSSSFDTIIGDKKVKKRKKKSVEVLEQKKKLKTDYDKQIDDSIESIIKRVSQLDDSIDEPLNDDKCEENTVIRVETKTISEELKTCDENDLNLSEEQINELKHKKHLNKSSFELYDQKRMKLLDETIDEIIAKQLVPSEFEQQIDGQKDVIVSQIQEESKTEEPKTTIIESSSPTLTTTPLKITEDPVIEEQPKPKPLVKQSSTCSTSSSMSSFISSVSESCHSLTSTLNLKLSESDLDLKLNVVMLVDGLLFVGQICPIQAPDIYGIVLHGERQHRPIIYSQEEMLREAIREVKPSLDELEEGQRVCAYWSTQYRHLYPGYVRSSSPHPNLVFVEFDDGDNGRISVEDIRLLPQDYPQMKINADPLKNLERRRRMSSCGNKDSKETRNTKHSDISNDNKVDDKKSEEMINSSMLSKNTSNKESIETNKKENNWKSISNKSCNTSDNRLKGSHVSTVDNMSSKSDSKKKKKKHNKEDRHHRHHHNHKHHHCRHHRKCKKHKKSREENGVVSTGSNTSLSTNCKVINEKTDHKIEKISTKSIVSRLNVKDCKECQQIKERSNAQSVSDNTINTINKSCENKDQNHLKSHLKPFIKKTPKQRALDRLQTNLSEKFCAITSPVRKRHSNDTNNTTTNSSASAPTPKKRERMPSAEKSKIAAFLPERQLWHWSGKYVKRTGNKGSRTRKVYYKEIERGREHIRVDDCAVFLSTGRPHLPYIGRIDSMWQTGSGTMIVKVRWFYHPEETKGHPIPLQDKRGALFESSHFDVNDVQTISHKCSVISWTEYQERKAENPSLLLEDPPNVYYSAGQYEALGGHIQMDPTVPLKDKPKEDKTEILDTNT